MNKGGNNVMPCSSASMGRSSTGNGDANSLTMINNGLNQIPDYSTKIHSKCLSSKKAVGGATDAQQRSKKLQSRRVTQGSSKKSKSVRPANRKPNINSLSGIRTLATLWILLGHFQDTAFRPYRSETFLLALNRGYIAVGVYIVLSGFITHYAYRKRTYNTVSSLTSFYVRRMGRVLFTYWASCLLGLIDPLFTRHDALASKYPVQAIATCLVFQSWLEFPDNAGWSRDIPNQPNPGGWTISTLVFAWVLYPFLNQFMKLWNEKTNSSIHWKFALIALLYGLAMFPTILLYVSQDGIITNQQFEFLYKFPPCRIFDFALGMVFSEMVTDPKVADNLMCKFLPDVAAIAFAVFVIFGDVNYQNLAAIQEPLPEQPLIRENAETFLISGLSPLICVILLGYSINSVKGRGENRTLPTLTGALEHPFLAAAGTFSFAIYCFQFTIYFMFEQWQFQQTGLRSFVETPEFGLVEVPAKLISAFLMPYIVALCFFSAWWTTRLEQPFAALLIRFVKRHFEHQKQLKQRTFAARNRTDRNIQDFEAALTLAEKPSPKQEVAQQEFATISLVQALHMHDLEKQEVRTPRQGTHQRSRKEEDDKFLSTVTFIDEDYEDEDEEGGNANNTTVSTRSEGGETVYEGEGEGEDEVVTDEEEEEEDSFNEDDFKSARQDFWHYSCTA